MNVPLEVTVFEALHARSSVRRRQLRFRLALFGLSLIFISAVSVHDAALVVINNQCIAEFEQNPLGRWLIELDGGDVWLFVTTKLISTAVVGAVLAAIYERAQETALYIAGSLALFQAFLLAYLCSS